jgi:hypothetical protein
MSNELDRNHIYWGSLSILHHPGIAPCVDHHFFCSVDGYLLRNKWRLSRVSMHALLEKSNRPLTEAMLNHGESFFYIKS